VEKSLILATTFLIDLERARLRGSNGPLIGANDIWVAATGLVYGVPVVTRNETHFRRVPGLTVIGYAAA
jgi:predicted nucleic acid-binding protein